MNTSDQKTLIYKILAKLPFDLHVTRKRLTSLLAKKTLTPAETRFILKAEEIFILDPRIETIQVNGEDAQVLFETTA